MSIIKDLLTNLLTYLMPVYRKGGEVIISSVTDVCR